NCSDDAVTLTEKLETLDGDAAAVIEAAAAEGIPTFVVGIAVENELTPNDALNPDDPGDARPDNINPFEVFNALAVLGQTPRAGDTRFYEPSDADALLDALAALPDATLDCALPLDPLPDYPALLEVAVDGRTVERRQAASCGDDGYRFTSDALDTIALCGDDCARFQVSGELTITYRCPGSKSGGS
ncbi:MAG: hypothetical protein KC486_29455, partial [Myxococcales bacterium]|nr:hypothetical protein [Myxococcales bacterium]